MCLLIDNMCHRKRNDYKIDMAIDTFWHESIVHKIGKVLINDFNPFHMLILYFLSIFVNGKINHFACAYIFKLSFTAPLLTSIQYLY